MLDTVKAYVALTKPRVIELLLVAVDRHTPLFVVVFNIIRLRQIDPRTTTFGNFGFTYGHG